MFTDQIEREMVENRNSAGSLQTWIAHVAEENQQRPPTPLWRRGLRSLGGSFIRFGSRLTRRFGDPEDTRQDRAYN